MISFTAYVRPEPQGSAKAFVRNGRAHITSDNAKLKPFRSEVTRCAIQAVAALDMELPMFGKHLPVDLMLTFTFRKPNSATKKRTSPVVKPDLDKIVRGTLDALTGVVFHDDAQVVSIACCKVYGEVEGVQVEARAA